MLMAAVLDCRCDPSTLSVATCGPNHTDNWQWSSDALRCGAHRLSMAELRAPLSKRWVVVAGDSIARFFFAAMLRLLSDDSEHFSLQLAYVAHWDISPIRAVP